MARAKAAAGKRRRDIAARMQQTGSRNAADVVDPLQRNDADDGRQVQAMLQRLQLHAMNSEVLCSKLPCLCPWSRFKGAPGGARGGQFTEGGGGGGQGATHVVR